MIFAQVGHTYEAMVEGMPTGLEGIIGIRVIDPTDDSTVLARTIAGISELVDGSGVYARDDMPEPAESGRFAVIWDSGGDDPIFASEELVVSAGPVQGVTGITPSLEEIGAINRGRTDDGKGDTLGTFTPATRPTDSDVEIIRVLAANEVANRLGNNIPDEFHDRARGIAALIAAALVDGAARDPREALMKYWTDLANKALEQLAAEIADVAGGGEDGPGDEGLLPLYSFPCADPLPPYA